MKSLPILTILFFSLKLYASSQIIVSGDSWSFLPCLFNSFSAALAESQLNAEVNNCLSTSKPGARAENFINSDAFKNTIEDLQKNENVRLVYLSLGGNDMFNYWSKYLDHQQEDELFNKIKTHIENIVLHFKQVRPDVFVLINGYDYGYLYDNNPIKAYREIYEQMGKPSPREVNSAFLRLNKVLSKIDIPSTVFIHHFGVMHYYYGIPEAGIKPYQSTNPQDISNPENILSYGGDINFHSNPQAMLHIFDCYYDPHHLSPTGYKYLIRHSIDLYLRDWL